MHDDRGDEQMAYDLVIANGNVVTALSEKIADVAIEGGKIAAVGRGIAGKFPDAKVIDAAGKWVLPGMLDVHVHLELPFMGVSALMTGTPAHGRRHAAG